MLKFFKRRLTGALLGGIQSGHPGSLSDAQRAYVRERLLSPSTAVSIAAARTLAKHGEEARAVRCLQHLKSSTLPEVAMIVDYTLAEIKK